MGMPNGRNGLDVEQLLRQMSLEEKVAQLGSVSVRDLLDGDKFSEAKAQERLRHGIGQITRPAGWSGLPPKEVAQLVNAIQRFLVEKTRLAIPAIVHEECLSGLMARGATTFPQAIGLASTWQPELIERMTTAIRREMRAIGAHQGLAPVLDVLRDPRWGRTEETMGEDHYLIAVMTAAYIRGLQGDDLRQGVIATAKHFAAHGFSEGGRNTAPVHVGERELREVFLFPFEVAVRHARVQSLMNAYHDLDGIPCAASRELLTDILRGEWGFDGIVVSDYGAVHMLMTVHRVASNEMEAACLALEAGIDVELPSTHCYAQLINAVRQGRVSEAVVDEAVRRVLRVKMRLGLFDNPFVDPDAAATIVHADEHRSLSLEIARKSIVLLKNDGNLLPLRKDLGTLAVVGPNADAPLHLLGDYTYAVHMNLSEPDVPVTSVLEAIKGKVMPTTKVLYAKGCEVVGGTDEGIAEAVAIARQADVVVLVVGDRSGLFNAPATSGEGRDRITLALPGHQMALVKAIVETGKPVVLVLVNGRPVTLGNLWAKIPAVVEAWLPGEMGGVAIAEVLFGEVNPGGKLPVTFPQDVGQIPLHYNRHASSFRDYVEGKATPQFPFGHGLSYTRFEYRDLSIEPTQISPAGTVRISVTVQNVGERDGDEVVQLYVRDVVACRVRPVKELKGFQRLTLKAGEAKRITFTLSADQLAFYDEAMRLIVEPGTFEVQVGSSSEDIRLRGTFEVVGEMRVVANPRTLLTAVSVSEATR